MTLTPFSSISSQVFGVDGPARPTRLLGPSAKVPNRMIVVETPDGAWVYNPLPWSEAWADALAAMGGVRDVIAPNSYRTETLPEWAARWPEARFWAPSSTPATPGMPPTVPLRDVQPTEWRGQFAVHRVEGHGYEELLVVHRESGTLFVADLIWNPPSSAWKGLPGLAARLSGVDRLQPPGRVRGSLWGLRRGCIETAQWVVAQPVRAVVPVVGAPVVDDVAAVLRGAFAYAGPDGPIPPPMRLLLGADAGGVAGFAVSLATLGGVVLGLTGAAPHGWGRLVLAFVTADILMGVVGLSLPSTGRFWACKGPAAIAALLGLNLVPPMLLVVAFDGNAWWGALLWLTAMLGAALVWLWPRADEARPLALLLVSLGAVGFGATAVGPAWLPALYLFKLVAGFALNVRPDVHGPAAQGADIR